MTTVSYVLIGLLAIIVISIIFILRYFKNKVEKVVGSAIGDGSEQSILVAIKDYIEVRLTKVRDDRLKAIWEEKAIQKSGIKSFYYLDERQINSLYSQIEEKDFNLKTIEKKKSRNKKLSARLTSTPLIASSEGESGNEVTEVYEATIKNTVSKYNRVEKYLFEEQNIIGHFEDFDRALFIEGTKIFKEYCNNFKKDYDYLIKEKDQEAHIQKLYSIEADRIKEGISKLTGYITLQLKVKLSLETGSDDKYDLVYIHPINDFYTSEEKPLQFKLICLKKNVQIGGTDTFSSGKSYSITMVGKVGGWDEKENTLEINPIAIY